MCETSMIELITDIVRGYDPDWDAASDTAREILKVLREPTERMMQMGAAAGWDVTAYAHVAALEDAWRAMIDEAMK